MYYYKNGLKYSTMCLTHCYLINLIMSYVSVKIFKNGIIFEAHLWRDAFLVRYMPAWPDPFKTKNDVA